jgi:hypothetical protein
MYLTDSAASFAGQAGKPGDTIWNKIGSAGLHHRYSTTGTNVTLKRGMSINLNSDTLISTAGTCISVTGDSVEAYGGFLMYATSGTQKLIYNNVGSPARMDGSKFHNLFVIGTGSSSRGLYFYPVSTQQASAPIYLYNNYFLNCPSIYYSSAVMKTNKRVYNNIFNGCAPLTHDSDFVSNNYILTGANEWSQLGTGDTVINNYSNASTNSGEHPSWDDNTEHDRGGFFAYNTIDSTKHNAMIDGIMNKKLYRNKFTHIYMGNGFPEWYNHGTSALDSMFDVSLDRNSMQGVGYIFIYGIGTHKSSDVSFKHNTYFNPGGTNYTYNANIAWVLNDTAAFNYYGTASNTVNDTSISSVHDNVYSVNFKSNFLDTVYWGCYKSNSAIANDSIGPCFKAHYKKSLALSGAGYKWIDSIDYGFRSPQALAGTWSDTLNTWFIGDSIWSKLRDSVAGGAWTTIDSTRHTKRAGLLGSVVPSSVNLDTFTYAAPTSGTHYIQIISKMVTNAGETIGDTTLRDSIVIAASGFYDTLWAIAGTGGTVSPASKVDTCTATFRDTATAAAHYAFSTWTSRNGRLTIPAPTNRFFAGTFTDQSVSKSDTIDAAFSCVAPTLAHVPAAHICTTGVAVIPWTPTIAETDSIKGRLPAGLSRHKTTGQVTGTPTTAAVKAGYQDTAWGCSAVYGADTITVVHITPTYTLTVATTGSGSSSGGGTYDSNSTPAIDNTASAGWGFHDWAITAGTGTLVSSATTKANSVLLKSNTTVTATDTALAAGADIGNLPTTGLVTAFLPTCAYEGNMAADFYGSTYPSYRLGLGGFICSGLAAGADKIHNGIYSGTTAGNSLIQLKDSILMTNSSSFTFVIKGKVTTGMAGGVGAINDGNNFILFDYAAGYCECIVKVGGTTHYGFLSLSPGFGSVGSSFTFVIVNNSGTMRGWINGTEVTYYQPETYHTVYTLGNISFLISVNVNYTTLVCTGDYTSVLHYTRALTDSEVVAVSSSSADYGLIGDTVGSGTDLILSTPITVNDFGDHQVFQRTINGFPDRAATSAIIPISGTVTGETGIITAMIRVHGGSTYASVDSIIKNWTPICTLAVAGAYSGKLSVPMGGLWWYSACVKINSDTARTSNKFAVGDIFTVAPAQSNGIGNGTLRGGASDTANDYVANWCISDLANEIGAWQRLSDPLRSGWGSSWCLQFGNTFTTDQKHPVGIVNIGISGTPMFDSTEPLYKWGFRYAANHYDPGTYYGKFLTATRSADSGKTIGLITYQGENDAGRCVAYTDYLQAIETWYGWARQDLGYQVPFFVVPLARETGQTDSCWNNVTSAWIQSTIDSQNIFIAATAYDLSLKIDSAHLTPPGIDTLGQRIYRASIKPYLAGTLNNTDFCRVQSASITGIHTIVINVNQNLAAGTSISCDTLTRNGAAMTITDRLISGKTITYTTSDSMIGTIKYRYGYGHWPSITHPLKTTDSIPVLPMIGFITAASTGGNFATIILVGSLSILGVSALGLSMKYRRKTM